LSNIHGTASGPAKVSKETVGDCLSSVYRVGCPSWCSSSCIGSQKAIQHIIE